MSEVGKTIALIRALGTPTDAQVTSAVEGWLDDHPEATTTVQDGAITNAKLATSFVTPGTATAYSSSATYAVGDYVFYNGALYRCTTAITTAESWTAAHWTAAVLGDEIGELKSKITRADNVLENYTGYKFDSALEQGAIINVQGGGVEFVDNPTRVRIPENSKISLTAGDTVGLLDYTGNRYMWFRWSDGTYVNNGNWLTTDLTISQPGDYCFVFSKTGDTPISIIPADFESLFFIHYKNKDVKTDIQNIVDNGVGFATNATNADNATNAQRATLAENAGFEWFFANDDVDFNRTGVQTTTFSDYVEFTRTDQDFSIDVDDFSVSRDSSLTCYAFGLWDIDDLVGKGKHIILDFTNSGYVSTNASYYINYLLLTKGYDFQNANVLYAFDTTSLQSKKARIEFDLDTLTDLSGEDHVRLLIGFSQSCTSSGGVVTGRGATTISVKAEMITGDVYATRLLGFDQSNYYTKSESDARYAQKMSWYYGKKICTFGDSLTGNGHTATDEVNTGYWQPMLHDYFGATIINVGVGGTTVVNNGEGSTQNGYNLTNSWMCSDERINMIPQDSDVIIFWGGHNDAYKMLIFNDLTIGQETPDDTTFTGAYQICLTKMIARCPNAMIICVTPHVARTENNADENIEFKGGNNRTLNDCADLVVAICHYYGFPVIDMRDSGLSVLNHAKYFSDTIHVNNTDGAKVVANTIINGLIRFEPIDFN